MRNLHRSNHLVTWQTRAECQTLLRSDGTGYGKLVGILPGKQRISGAFLAVFDCGAKLEYWEVLLLCGVHQLRHRMQLCQWGLLAIVYERRRAPPFSSYGLEDIWTEHMWKVVLSALERLQAVAWGQVIVIKPTVSIHVGVEFVSSSRHHDLLNQKRGWESWPPGLPPMSRRYVGEQKIWSRVLLTST